MSLRLKIFLKLSNLDVTYGDLPIRCVESVRSIWLNGSSKIYGLIVRELNMTKQYLPTLLMRSEGIVLYRVVGRTKLTLIKYRMLTAIRT